MLNLLRRCFVLLGMLWVLLLTATSTDAQIVGIKISGDTCNSLTLSCQVLGTSSSPFFFWHFNDPNSGTNDSITITGNSPNPFPTHTFSAPGVYTICVAFQEPGLPVDTICRTIAMGLCCLVNITYSDTCVERPITFGLMSSASINSVQWHFGDPNSGSNNQSSALMPVHQFSLAGTYTITAIVNNDCGIDTFSTTLRVNACNTPPSGNTTCPAYFPNAFSPNNDGLNDDFGLITTTNCSWQEFQFTVYNRWGQAVFTSKDPSQTWYGQYLQRDCPSGTYFYVAQYRLPNGELITQRGDVMLVR